MGLGHKWEQLGGFWAITRTDLVNPFLNPSSLPNHQRHTPRILLRGPGSHNSYCHTTSLSLCFFSFFRFFAFHQKNVQNSPFLVPPAEVCRHSHLLPPGEFMTALFTALFLCYEPLTYQKRVFLFFPLTSSTLKTLTCCTNQLSLIAPTITNLFINSI